MVPMRGWKTVGTFHEPSRLRVADPRSGPRLCEAQRFMVPMRAQKRKEALHESGGARLRRALISDGYKLGLDGVSPHRSSPQLTSNFLELFPAHEPKIGRAWGALIKCDEKNVVWSARRLTPLQM